MADSCHWKVLPQHDSGEPAVPTPFASTLSSERSPSHQLLSLPVRPCNPIHFESHMDFFVFTYRDNKFLIQAKQLYNKHREQTAEGKLDRPFLDSSLNTKSTWMTEGLPPPSFLFWTRHSLWISASSSFNYTSGSSSHKEHLKIMTSIDRVNPRILGKSLLQQFNMPL